MKIEIQIESISYLFSVCTHKDMTSALHIHKSFNISNLLKFFLAFKIKEMPKSVKRILIQILLNSICKRIFYIKTLKLQNRDELKMNHDHFI